MQFFTVKDDDLSRELHKRLLAKVRDGVKVYFLFDEVGSHSLPKSYLAELRDAGVETDIDLGLMAGNRYRQRGMKVSKPTAKIAAALMARTL